MYLVGFLPVPAFFAGDVADAMASGVFKSLTRKNGVKIAATFPCSVEEISLAVGEKVGHVGIKSAARMNSAVVIFLDRVEKVNRLVETGITVKDTFVPVLPLTQPATKVVLSNVPPFISDEFLSRELSRHGKVVSPLRMIPSGCKSPLLKHVVSHRRQLYMILNKRDEDLNLRFLVKVDDYEYVIFATSAGMRCFGCGGEGHTVRSCPASRDPVPPGPGEPAAAPQPAQEAPPPRAEAPSGPPAAEEPVASSERPVEAPRVTRRESADVSDQEHGVSTTDTPGVSMNEVGEMSGSGVNENGQKEGEEKGIDGECEQMNEGGVMEKENVSEVCERMENRAGDSEGKGDKRTDSSLWSEQVEGDTAAGLKPKAGKKRRKTRNTNEAKTSKIDQSKVVSESESEEWVTDDSDFPHMSNSQKKKLYSAENIKSFLQQTKNQRGVKITDFFPDIHLFYLSAKASMSNKEEAGITAQEIHRLRKLVLKAKHMLDDGKGSYVGFN